MVFGLRLPCTFLGTDEGSILRIWDTISLECDHKLCGESCLHVSSNLMASTGWSLITEKAGKHQILSKLCFVHKKLSLIIKISLLKYLAQNYLLVYRHLGILSLYMPRQHHQKGMICHRATHAPNRVAESAWSEVSKGWGKDLKKFRNVL